MVEATIQVTFSGHDTITHTMTNGTHAEGLAVANEVYDTYMRLLRTGLGTLKNVNINVDVYMGDTKIAGIS